MSTLSVTVVSSLPMAQSLKFRDAVSGAVVRISSLDIDKRSPVLYAERLETIHGTAVLLTTRKSSDNVIKVFLQRRYSVIFTDDDITIIHGMTVQYHLTYLSEVFQVKLVHVIDRSIILGINWSHQTSAIRNVYISTWKIKAKIYTV